MDTKFLKRRLYNLREVIGQDGMRAAVLSRPQHIFYFTGITPGPAPILMVVTPERLMFVAPASLPPDTLASAPLEAIETVTYSDYDIRQGWDLTNGVRDALDRALSAALPIGRTVGLELDHLPAAWMAAALKHLREPRELKDILWTLRQRKDAEELRQIEANVAANDRAFAAVQAGLQAGMRELEIWSIAQNGLNDAAGGPVVLEGDLGGGPRGSSPDAKPGHERVQPGEHFFIDIYSATAGYYADTTRVFVLGQPTYRQQEIHAILLAVLQAGEKELRPGVPANQVDAMMRGMIERAGYGDYFPHHSGHAFGLFQQEKPYLIPAETLPLEAGMVIALEPGIYLPGWGGMRLEGNWVITKNGARRLDGFPSDLIVCE